MIELNALEPYEDENGNVIVYEGRYDVQITVIFRGSNNRLEVAPGTTSLRHLRVVFDRDNGTLRMGHNNRINGGNWGIRIGADATVSIGNNVSTSGRCSVSAVEGVSVEIGNDVMISTDVKVRADDGHAIFDVRTGKRINPAKSIVVGNHVWLGWGSTVLAGAQIGQGSVIGTRAVVTGKIPNNCTAAGMPAKVLRRDIAWERPHLSLDTPAYKPDISVMHQTKRFWALTEVEAEPASFARRVLRRLKRTVRR